MPQTRIMFSIINHSMIFKTFDSDVDNMSSKWGMFGKSFSDIGNDITTKWKQVTDYISVTNDATLSGIANAWSGSKPLEFLETSRVETILNDYNKALDKGAEATAKFMDAGTGVERCTIFGGSFNHYI